MKRFLLCMMLAGIPRPSMAQVAPPSGVSADSVFIRSIYDEVLLRGRGYDWLRHLCLNIGHRLSGSESAHQAVNWAKSVMDSLGLDRVFLQPVMVPHWERGVPESVKIIQGNGTILLSALALGNSASTSGELQAEVIEVPDIEALNKLPREAVEGKIVFINMPFNEAHIHTFTCYGETYAARRFGPSVSSSKGAVACLIRSLTHSDDDFPHTGNTGFDEGVKPIPCAALGIRSANRLHDELIRNPRLKVAMTLNCRTFPDKISYNVIGEIRGSEYPDTYILAGGHLDSWDVGQGAHDDGAGCVQSVEVLRTFKALGYKPRHTIRAVLFMNEENGLRGAMKYAEEARRNKEIHLAAIESDAGGFTPRGFNFENNAKAGRALMSWKPLLEPYLLHRFQEGGSGADIGPLKANGPVALFGYRPDEQRYFDYHHASSDTFDKISKRELDLGSAAITALIYLIDKQAW
jgi:Zn-dependent M28 family amino/carboxypeptidase